MPNRRAAGPPAPVLRAVTAIRGALARLHAATAPANVATLELAMGSWLTQALYVTVRLGIADELARGPLAADQVATRVRTDPDATYRLLRLLASRSVLKLRRDGRFALTRMGQTLRHDHPDSIAAMVTLVGCPQHWEHWGSALHAVQTGQPAVQAVRGMAVWDYFGKDPDFAAIFNDAMTAQSRVAIQTAVPAYDFTDRSLIVDVGGGHGALLAAVLTQARDARGVLFDQPAVIADAGAPLRAAGVAERASLQGGSFFESVPAGGDAYLLKTVIHDWHDDESVAILRTVRAAIAPHGKLLLFELVLPDGAPNHLGMLVDLEMLVSAGGQERTAAQYADLLSRSGFRCTRVIPTAGPMSIIEAVPD